MRSAVRLMCSLLPCVRIFAAAQMKIFKMAVAEQNGDMHSLHSSIQKAAKLKDAWGSSGGLLGNNLHHH